VLRVRDNGLGVPKDQLKQLTTPFFRGEAARTAANGTGLGLAIVQKIVSRMGGTLELSNASDGGLCANIRLQLADAG
jgi:two-component system osmolarity sensor histidine kinase EnvZ